MITIDFDNRGNMGLCDYIIDSIKNQVIDGTLKPESKMPSKRALAEHLGVSIITVQNAYGELISEGYLYSVEKKGFFVTDIKAVNIAKNDKADLYKDIYSEESRKLSNNSILTKEEENLKKEAPYISDLNSNSIGSDLFPFSQWAHIMRQVLNTSSSSLLQKQGVYGSYELRSAIARHLQGFRNMKVIPEQIVIGAGTEYLYSLVVQFLGRDKVYAVENPGYQKVASVISLNGAECVAVDIDEMGLSIENLCSTKANVVHVSPSHHFPTGVVMPIKRRNELLSWAYEKNDRYIIEDDYDSEFRFKGKPLETLQSLDNESKVIYINTFSKTLSPSFRISYMILPINMLQTFNSKLGFYSCPVSAFEQYALASFIDQGHYEKHLIRMKNYYRNLRNSLIYALENSDIKELLQINEEEAGLHFLLTIKTDKDGKELQDILRAKKINLLLLQDFYYTTTKGLSDNQNKKDSPCCFVVNYTAIQKNHIAEIVSLLTLAVL